MWRSGHHDTKVSRHRRHRRSDAIVAQSLCSNCIGEALLSAVASLDVPCSRDLAETRKRASEASRAYAQVERAAEEITALKAKLQEVRAEATPESQYAVWLTERADMLQQLDALKSERDVALAQAQNKQRTAADQAKAAEAATKQAAIDAQHDPAYVEAVARRESRRMAGR